MLTQYELRMPRAVFAGEHAMKNISTILRDNGASRIAIFTDKGIESAGLLELPLAEIKRSGAAYTVLNDLPPEPSYAEAQTLVDQCKEYRADFILACGGGSTMDTAKLASVLMTDEYGIRELLDDPSRAKKCVSSLAIPTTAGTGSEATPNAIVGVPERQLKIGIVNAAMIYDYVILDVAMIKNLPRKIAAASGVDAMAHAIECYTSRKANPFSDVYALAAFDKILNNIERACDDPEADRAKEAMLLAAFYGGIAITCSGTTAVHALSYPLGGKYHIAHGISNAILLMPVMRFNEPSIRSRLAEAFDFAVHEKTDCRTAEEKSLWLINRMNEIVTHLGIPTSLAEFGVPKEDLEGLVRAGMAVTRLLENNMREITPEDARRIYQEVL